MDRRLGGAGTARGHYFHQDLLVARRIFQRRPERHVDVGTRIDGFVAHVATFRPIGVLDIRAMTDQVPNVTFRQGDPTFNSHRIYRMEMVRDWVKGLRLLDEIFIKRKPARRCAEAELATSVGEFDVYCGCYALP